MVHAFFYGALLAFGLIVPLGVQNIFVFNQGALQPRYLKALPSVITATVCDFILIVLAVLGISIFVLTLPWLKKILFVIGFCFLLYMGWVTWHSHSQGLNKMTALGAKRQMGFALSVSLLNPHALIDTVGVIGTASLNFNGNEKIAFTLACMLVSFCWFLGLSLCGRLVNRLDKQGTWLSAMNKLSALIIWSVALLLGWQLLAGR
jgi:L-lysine exporter family protein LysE/ArgO